MNSAFVQICDLVDRSGAEFILVGITLHLQDTDPVPLSDYTGFGTEQLSDTGAQIVEIAVLRDDITAPAICLQGHHPGDEEWNKLGIARYVTWPRTVCSIEGHDVNGAPLKGNYISDQEFPMADGFKANAIFFKLGFLNKNSVALGRQFRELLPVLWMKAGAIGKCPELDTDVLPNWLILPENKMAVLIDDNEYRAFKEEMNMINSIETLYIITDFEREYAIMADELGIPNTFQLYRDYLDNFRINSVRR